MSLKKLRLKRTKQLSKLEAIHRSLEDSIDKSLIVILSKADPTRKICELETKTILTAAQALYENTVTAKALGKTIRQLREELSG